MNESANTINKAKTRMLFALGASLTLGLAPFRPEPHLFGKVKWILGGGEGMQLMDYFDLLMHGAPWILLVIFTIRYVALKRNSKT